jgi:hypothetical protein
MTLVDDQQIDCVVRLEVNTHPVYIDVQIKARSADAKHPGTFAGLTVRDPRPNFMFVFYSEASAAYWIMPSLDLVKEATRNKGGRNAGKYTINFANPGKDGQACPRPRGLIRGETAGSHSTSWQGTWPFDVGAGPAQTAARFCGRTERRGNRGCLLCRDRPHGGALALR